MKYLRIKIIVAIIAAIILLAIPYYVAGQEQEQEQQGDMKINPTATVVLIPDIQETGKPGFEAAFVVVGLLAIAFLVLRERK